MTERAGRSPPRTLAPALVAFLLAIVSAGRIRGLDALLLDRGPLDRLPRWAKG